MARFVFRHLRARRFCRDWDGYPPTMPSAACAPKPSDARQHRPPGLVDLIEELATRGEEFARRGDPPDVEYYRSGQQCFHHPPSAPRASDQGRMFGSVQENGFGPTFWWCAGFSGSRA
ncbi:MULTISPECIES: MmyB family transcriptional regulator [Streptomyces]|uniref:MmyB family transcriptional regulator n=1 Tax=Streptomyces TaxID=1883 RepID=UPI0033FE21F1